MTASQFSNYKVNRLTVATFLAPAVFCPYRAAETSVAALKTQITMTLDGLFAFLLESLAALPDFRPSIKGAHEDPSTLKAPTFVATDRARRHNSHSMPF